MALATKPKRATHYKKLNGRHHRQSKPYLKTYWPYLPMFFIVSAGALVNEVWTVGTVSVASSSVLNSQFATTTQPTSRLAALTGSHAVWLLPLAGLISLTALVLFAIRHARRLHRAIIKGEAFVIHHPWLDIATVLIFTVGFVLIRSHGFMH